MSDERTGAFALEPRVALALVLLACAVGAGLRVWQLGDQVVQGDERWALAAALRHDPAYLVSHHRVAVYTYSVPLALWNWALLHSVGLGEWGMRLPGLLAGLLFPPLLGWLGWRAFGPRVAALSAWLAALAPLLILYSRFARPYMGVALLVLLTLLAWLRWLAQRRAGWGLAAAGAGAATIYLHFLAAPTVLCIWGWGIASDWRWRALSPQAWKRSAAWAGAGLALLGLALAPSAADLVDFAGEKRGAAAPGAAEWWRAAGVLLGVYGPLPLAWLAASALLGGASAWRRSAWLTGLLAASAGAQLLGIALLAPPSTDWSLVLARYALPLLPGLMLLVAAGLAAQGELAGRALRLAPRWRPLLVLPLLVLVASAGPLPRLLHTPSSFLNHPDYYTGPAPWLRPGSPSRFYAFLAEASGPLRIAEAPDVKPFIYTPYGFYQELHRRPVVTLSPEEAFRADGVGFHSVRPVASDGVDLAGLDYVLVHKNIAAEVDHVTDFPNPRRDGELARLRAGDKRVRYNAGLHVARAARVRAACEAIPTLELVWEDDWIAVWATHPDAAARARAWDGRQSGS